MLEKLSTVDPLFLTMQSGHYIFYLCIDRVSGVVRQLPSRDKSTFGARGRGGHDFITEHWSAYKMSRWLCFSLQMETAKKGYTRLQRALWYFIAYTARVHGGRKSNQHSVLSERVAPSVSNEITHWETTETTERLTLLKSLYFWHDHRLITHHTWSPIL